MPKKKSIQNALWQRGHNSQMPLRLEQYAIVFSCPFNCFLWNKSLQGRTNEPSSSIMTNCRQLVPFSSHYAFSETIKPSGCDAWLQTARHLCKIPKVSAEIWARVCNYNEKTFECETLYLPPSGQDSSLNVFLALKDLKIICLGDKPVTHTPGYTGFSSFI